MFWLELAVLAAMFAGLALLAGSLDRPANDRRVRERLARGRSSISSWQI